MKLSPILAGIEYHRDTPTCPQCGQPLNAQSEGNRLRIALAQAGYDAFSASETARRELQR